jgi:uncharacterized membrane protein
MEESPMTEPTPLKVSLAPLDCLAQGHEITREHFWPFVGICAVGTILASLVPMGIVLGPLMCGIYLCLFEAMEGTPPSFDTLFRGFDHFAESLVATLIVIGVAMLVVVPLYVVMVALLILGAGASAQTDVAVVAAPLLVLGLFVVAILVLTIAISVVFTFVYPLIVDRGLKAIPALRVSWEAARINFWGMTLLLLLIGVVTTVASVFCYLPIFLVLPACIGSIVVAYRKVFPEASAVTA